jgi:penicillin-binding protein 2
MSTRFRIKDHWAEQRLFLRRALIAAGLVLALLCVLLARLIQLQVVRYEHYAQLSQGNRVRVEPIPPSRGLILDRNGVVLAENLPAYQLELTAEQTPDTKAALEGLSALGLVTVEEIPQLLRTIRSRRSFEGVPIRLRMSEEEVALFAVHRHDFPGVDIRPRLTRRYPLGATAVHALGYVGAISAEDLARIDRDAYAGTSLIGKLGLEAAYEKQLHGKPGYRQMLVNAQGRQMNREGALRAGLTSSPATPGNDLILSLDVNVQRVAETALAGRRGAAVALDPSDGSVIAFVSLPGFDPNRFGRSLTVAEYDELQHDIDRPLFNRSLRGTYPPGSTIKPQIALAGLAHGVINRSHEVICHGQWRMPGVRRPWSEGRGGVHGRVDLIAAIGRSCDVYFYDLADELGVDRLSSSLAPFGFGQLTGIDMPGEKIGVLPSREWKRQNFSRQQDKVWLPGDTVNFGIGQGYMSVTPLQLAHATAVIAARGRRFAPRLAAGVRDGQSGEVRKLPAQALPGMKAQPAQWQAIVDGMRAAMTGRGTARAIAQGAPYSIAGKTGTAQVVSIAQGEKYDEETIAERQRDHSWFVAFAPVDDPRIAVAVLVENGGFGASAAAPIARRILDAHLLGPDADGQYSKPSNSGTGE